MIEILEPVENDICVLCGKKFNYVKLYNETDFDLNLYEISISYHCFKCKVLTKRCNQAKKKYLATLRDIEYLQFKTT